MIRVLVISSEQPLWVGIKAILGKESNLDLISLPSSDQKVLLREIDDLKPAVIVVDEKFPSADLTMILNLQKTYSMLRVVVVSLRENQLQIYDKRDIFVSELKDFISAVQSK